MLLIVDDTQNYEGIILGHALRDVEQGFYIDSDGAGQEEWSSRGHSTIAARSGYEYNRAIRCGVGCLRDE